LTTIHRQIFMILNQPMIVLRERDGSYSVEDANEAFQRLVGYPLDYMLRTPSSELILYKPDLSRRILKSELVILARNGNRLSVRIEQIPLPDRRDGCQRALIIAEDLTAYHWIDRQFEHGKVLLSGVVNQHLHVRFIRDSLAPLLFQPDRTLDDESLLQFIADREHQMLKELLDCAALSMSEQRTVLHTTKQSGVELELEITFKPVADGFGQVKEVAFVIWDFRPVDDGIDSATRLKIWMAKRDISSGQLAGATGISIQTISKLRNGKIEKPQRLTAELIASELCVDVHEIWPSIRK
jgi:Predicted transcriptional regulator